MSNDKEPIEFQLEMMIRFLKSDIEQDKAELRKYPWLSFRQRFMIKRQIRITKKQIKHYEDKLEQYRNDDHT